MSIFKIIGQLYSKEGLNYDELPSDFVLHRFLASSRVLAQVAKEFQLHIRDRKLMYGCWDAFIQKGKAPYFNYVLPKREEDSPLVKRIKQVEGLKDEELALLFKIADLEDLHNYYGVELEA
jgi:hypothetical protein